MASCSITSILGKIQSGKQTFLLRLHWRAKETSPNGEKIFELSRWGREKIFALAKDRLDQLMRDHPKLPLDQIRWMGSKEVCLAKNQKIPCKPLENSLSQILEKRQAKPLQLPSPQQGNIPEPPLVVKDLAKVEFRFIDEPRVQDRIACEQPLAKRTFSSRADMIREATWRLAQARGKEYDPDSAMTRDSLCGVSNSLWPRKHYEMEISLQGPFAKWRGKERVVSRQIFAFNGLNGLSYRENGQKITVSRAVSASFNRFSPSPTLLRKIEAEDGTSNCYAGRVDLKGEEPLSKAKEMVKFLFLSEMDLYKKGKSPKGISSLGNGKFEFRFAVQSLLSMTPYSGNLKMFREEVAAYEKLQKQGVIQIPDQENPFHPKDDASSGTPPQIYFVRLSPIPVAARQFNFMNTFEKVMPCSISGEEEAREASKEADAILFQWAREKMAFSDAETKKQMEDAIAFLNEGELKPWQEMLTRAFLCHLLEVPEAIHCQSSVDRTGIGIGVISAMKEWLRAGKAIPKDANGRYAIFLLPELAVLREGAGKNEVFFPFRELFAYHLHMGLKLTEFSRGAKGFKLHKGWLQNPALRDLLPSRYLEEISQPNLCKKALASVGIFLLVLIVALVTLPYAFYRWGWKGLLEGFVAPFKAAGNVGHLFPQKIVKESFQEVGRRRLLSYIPETGEYDRCCLGHVE